VTKPNEEPAEPIERVVVEHERPVSSELASLSNDERAFKRWMDEQALDDEPEAGELSDEEEPG
jgi:hypothetical protein